MDFLLTGMNKFIDVMELVYSNNNKANIILQEFIKIHNCIITSSVMVDKSLFNSIGGFDGLPNGVGDYDCWLRLLSETNLAYIDEPLFYYDGTHGSGRNY